jgi:hypothetical protein
MKHLLIGSEGESFPATAAAVERRLGFTVAMVGTVEYVVRNMGFVELRFDAGRLRVAARPRLVSPLAVAGLAATVARWRVGRVALSLLGDGWTFSIHATVAGALGELRRVCRETSTHPGWSLFEAKKLRLDGLDGPPYDAMHLLTAEWQTLGGEMDAEMRSEFLSRRSTANVFLARPSSDRESVVVEHCRLPDKPWTSSWMRRADIDLRTQPDTRYIGWVTRAYREVLATGRPRLERIRAELRCPERGPRLFDYDRLILPWRTPAGDRVATVISVVRDVVAASPAA